MLWGVSFLLLLYVQAAPTEPRPGRPTWAQIPVMEDAARCTQPLPLQSIDVRVVSRCRLDADGKPGSCTLRTPETLPEDQMTAVRCIIDTYRFKMPNGESTAGVELNVPVRLKLTS